MFADENINEQKNSEPFKKANTKEETLDKESFLGLIKDYIKDDNISNINKTKKEIANNKDKADGQKIYIIDFAPNTDKGKKNK